MIYAILTPFAAVMLCAAVVVCWQVGTRDGICDFHRRDAKTE
jgi:hypothetical protein